MKSQHLVSVPVKVYFYDIDMTRTAFFTNHLKWIDSVAFPELCKKAGMEWEVLIENNIDLAIVHLSIDYKNPVFMDDTVMACIDDVQLGQKSMTIHGSLHKDQALIAEGKIVYAFVDLITRESIPAPDMVREKIEAIKKAKG